MRPKISLSGLLSESLRPDDKETLINQKRSLPTSSSFSGTAAMANSSKLWNDKHKLTIRRTRLLSTVPFVRYSWFVDLEEIGEAYEITK